MTLAFSQPRWPDYVAAQRKALDQLTSHCILGAVSYLFKRKDVQYAIVNAISCHTPIGLALNDQINACIEGSDLDRTIESAIEDFMRHNDCNVSADDIKDLDEAVRTIIEDDSTIVDAMSTAIMEKIAEKLSR